MRNDDITAFRDDPTGNVCVCVCVCEWIVQILYVDVSVLMCTCIVQSDFMFVTTRSLHLAKRTERGREMRIREEECGGMCEGRRMYILHILSLVSGS